MIEYDWVGSQKHFVDELSVWEFENRVWLGRFGGNSSAGQCKNEDGCLIWAEPEENWEFVMLLDAHNTAQSAELVLSTIRTHNKKIVNVLKLGTSEAFNQIQLFILSVFSSQKFKEACQKIKGETACLIVVRKENYIFWLSIGDCVLYLNHPEISVLGEYQQNHRSFYEWIGQESSFHHSVPCYSMGIKELRKGKNQIFLTTDGLIECPNTNISSPDEIFRLVNGIPIKEGLIALLNEVKKNNVRDSTTIISWEVFNKENAITPSDINKI